jgi:uncharacterized ferredoxin-like protein
VGQGLDAGGIHSLHFLDDAEKSVQLREHALTFGVEARGAPDWRCGQCLGVSAIEKMPTETRCKAVFLRPDISYSQGIRYYLGFAAIPCKGVIVQNPPHSPALHPGDGRPKRMPCLRGF